MVTELSDRKKKCLKASYDFVAVVLFWVSLGVSVLKPRVRKYKGNPSFYKAVKPPLDAHLPQAPPSGQCAVVEAQSTIALPGLQWPTTFNMTS